MRPIPARTGALTGALFAVLGLPVAAPAAVAGSRAARADAPTTAEATLGRAVVSEINDQRRRRGLRRLKSSPKLAAIANQHSDEQLGTRLLTHTGLGNTTSGDRIRAASPAIRTGEVIGFLGDGSTGPAAKRLVAMWLGSPRHRAIILGRRFTRIGVGSGSGFVGTQRGLLVTADLAGR